jgi:uncharacterized protein (DUF2062 family)
MNFTDTPRTPLPTGIRPLIVIPAYNNAPTLRGVAEGALATGLPVLVVNDGSTDGGPATAADLPLKLINLPTNQGKGAAILTGADWATARGFTNLITVDADGQHDPREALRFVRKIEEHPWAIIVGARDLAGAAAPGSSRFGRHFSNFWLKVSTGAGLPDSQSGFRAYPLAALRRLGCAGRRYEFEVEFLVRTAWAGLTLESVPISVRYEAPGRRVSHFRPFIDNMRISKIYARSTIRNFLPWPHKRLTLEGMPEPERLPLRDPVRLIRMLLREAAAPRQIAAAAMLGIFLGTLPLIACHSVVIIIAATRLRLNRLLALNISHICAPPLVPALAIEAGHFMRHGRFLTEFNMRTLGLELHHRFFEYLIGSLVVGPVLALAAGVATYGLARLYQRIAARLKVPEAGA